MTIPALSGGFGSYAMFGGNASGTSNLSHTLTLPSHNAGDMFIAVCVGTTQAQTGTFLPYAVSSGTPAGTTVGNTAIDFPAGWTTLVDEISAVNAGLGKRTRLKVAYKIATSSSETDPTITGASSGGSSPWNNSTGSGDYGRSGFRAVIIPKVINFGSFNGPPAVSFKTPSTSGGFTPTPSTPVTASGNLQIGFLALPTDTAGGLTVGTTNFLNLGAFAGLTSPTGRVVYGGPSTGGAYSTPTWSIDSGDAAIAAFLALSSRRPSQLWTGKSIIGSGRGIA